MKERLLEARASGPRLCVDLGLVHRMSQKVRGTCGGLDAVRRCWTCPLAALTRIGWLLLSSPCPSLLLLCRVLPCADRWEGAKGSPLKWG